MQWWYFLFSAHPWLNSKVVFQVARARSQSFIMPGQEKGKVVTFGEREKREAPLHWLPRLHVPLSTTHLPHHIRPTSMRSSQAQKTTNRSKLVELLSKDTLSSLQIMIGPHQIGSSIHIMVELSYFSLDKWENEIYMGQFPQDGENGQNVAFLYFLELCCD